MRTQDYHVSISADARAKLESEQRKERLILLMTDIAVGSGVGLVVSWIVLICLRA